MNSARHWLGVVVGVALGGLGAVLFTGPARPLQARPNDRFEDYVMVTGACAVNPRAPTDGVWLLDSKGGRLLGTVIDRNQGRIVGWAEVDLATEFGVAPKQGGQFIMTTGNIAAGQAALYVAEVNSGRLGVYTLGPDPNAQLGVVIRRHDLSNFRKQAAGSGG